VTAHEENLLTAPQLEAFGAALHDGATEASDALARWIGRPTSIRFDALEQLPLYEATGVLGTAAEPICCCVAEMHGRLTGELILAFDDASGLALADMLLDQPRGTATEWDEMATSAALETTNILCCSYLNALSRAVPAAGTGSTEMIPSPPRFSRDFAESLIEFALMGQVLVTDHVLLARSQFHIDGAAVDWTLLFVPDAQSMTTLREQLG
jgi:chemotaxis protein CheC